MLCCLVKKYFPVTTISIGPNIYKINFNQLVPGCSTSSISLIFSCVGSNFTCWFFRSGFEFSLIDAVSSFCGLVSSSAISDLFILTLTSSLRSSTFLDSAIASSFRGSAFLDSSIISSLGSSKFLGSGLASKTGVSS